MGGQILSYILYRAKDKRKTLENKIGDLEHEHAHTKK